MLPFSGRPPAGAGGGGGVRRSAPVRPPAGGGGAGKRGNVAPAGVERRAARGRVLQGGDARPVRGPGEGGAGGGGGCGSCRARLCLVGAGGVQKRGSWVARGVIDVRARQRQVLDDEDARRIGAPVEVVGQDVGDHSKGVEVGLLRRCEVG